MGRIAVVILNAHVNLTDAYARNLLSNKGAHATPGMLWITRQMHTQIVAIAVRKESVPCLSIKTNPCQSSR